MFKSLRAVSLTVLIISCLIIHPSQVSAKNLLQYFYGGNMHLEVNLISQLVTGPGLTSVTGCGAAPSSPDAFQVFRNPAGLRYLYKQPTFGYSFKMPLLIEWPDMVQQELKTQINDVNKNYRKLGAYEYTKASGGIGTLGSSFASFAFAYPVFPYQIAVGYSRVFQLDLDLVFTGLSQRLDTDSSDPADIIRFKINNSMFNRLQLSADSWVAGISRDIGDSWSVGASVTRTFIDFRMDGGYKVDGSLSRVGQVWAFGDPETPWYNNLGGEADGGYNGSNYDFKFGAQFVPGWEDHWRFGADVKIATGATLKGNLHLIVDEFPALLLNPDAGEENFDVNRIEDITEMTKTTPNEYFPADEMDIHIPSSFSIGASYGKGSKPMLQYTQYFGKLGYELVIQEKRITDTEYAVNTYALGMKPKWNAYFSITPGGFFMGLGAISAEIYSDGHKNPSNGKDVIENSNVIIPRLDLGFTKSLGYGITYEILITGLPEDAFRMGITYDF